MSALSNGSRMTGTPWQGRREITGRVPERPAVPAERQDVISDLLVHLLQGPCRVDPDKGGFLRPLPQQTLPLVLELRGGGFPLARDEDGSRRVEQNHEVRARVEVGKAPPVDAPVEREPVL